MKNYRGPAIVFVVLSWLFAGLIQFVWLPHHQANEDQAQCLVAGYSVAIRANGLLYCTWPPAVRLDSENIVPGTRLGDRNPFNPEVQR